VQLLSGATALGLAEVKQYTEEYNGPDKSRQRKTIQKHDVPL